jgi:hypothetical protein
MSRKEYSLLDSLDTDLVALDFLRVLDYAQEDRILQPGFALKVTLSATSVPVLKRGQWKTERFRAVTREPVRGYAQAYNFLFGHLNRFAVQSPRGFDSVRVSAEETRPELDAVRIAASF